MLFSFGGGGVCLMGKSIDFEQNYSIDARTKVQRLFGFPGLQEPFKAF